MVVVTPQGSVTAAGAIKPHGGGSVIHGAGAYADDDAEEEEGSKELGRPLTAAFLKNLARTERRMYYSTPHLNDKLYIHYGGFTRLADLHEWTGLRVIYADCNAISTIEALDTCTDLRSLHLNQNCIRKIEGLDHCHELWTLSLTENYVRKIEGLSHLKRLNTLTIDKNHIGYDGLDDIIHLKDTSINTLDLKDNKIDDPACLEEVFMKMPELRVLYLKGNPVVKKIPNYRKKLIASMPNLRYLDDRPVFPEDARYANAFMRGGIAEERLERKKIQQEKEDEHKRNMDAFKQMVERAKREGRERRDMQTHDRYSAETDPVAVAREARLREHARQHPNLYQEDAVAQGRLTADNLGGLAIDANGETDSQAATRTPQSRRSGQTGLTQTDAATPAHSTGGTSSAPPTAPTSAVDAQSETKSEVDAKSDHGGEKTGIPALDEVIPTHRGKESRPVKYEDIWDDEPCQDAAAADEPFLPWMSADSESTGMPAASPEVMQEKLEQMMDQIGAAKGKGKGWYKDLMESDDMKNMVGDFWKAKEAKDGEQQNAEAATANAPSQPEAGAVRLPIQEEDEEEETKQVTEQAKKIQIVDELDELD